MKSISIVIPCFNAEKFIKKCIDSILIENLNNVEIIVIDDGSTDQSLKIISDFSDRIIWVTGKNQGVSSARNKGLKLAKFDFVLFLDADDYLLPGYLGVCVEEIDRADLLISNFMYERNYALTPSKRLLRPVSVEEFFDSWIDGNFIPPCGLLWRKDFIESIGGWDESLNRNEDGELTLRALLFNPYIKFSTIVSSVYVDHDSVERVSRRFGRLAIESEGMICTKLLKIAQKDSKLKYSPIKQSIAKMFYKVAYSAYVLEYTELGDLYLGEARALGLKGHIGLTTHKILSHIFGLKNKLVLSKHIKRWASKL